MPRVWSELHEAKNCSPERVSELLSTGAVDIDHADQYGCTPLIAASAYGFSSVAKVLLGKGADVAIISDGTGPAANVTT